MTKVCLEKSHDQEYHARELEVSTAVLFQSEASLLAKMDATVVLVLALGLLVGLWVAVCMALCLYQPARSQAHQLQ